MQAQATTFRDLTIPELVSMHNRYAMDRGVDSMREWHGTTTKLVERIAILKTRPIVPSFEPAPAKPAQPNRSQPIRDATLRALSIVSHYEHKETGARVRKSEAALFKPAELFAVGLSFARVLARVKKQFPESKVCERDLRWTVTHVRYGSQGFENCKLPVKRARPTHKRKHTK